MKTKKSARTRESNVVADQNGGGSSGDCGTQNHGPRHEEIAFLAYQIWEAEGCPQDRAMEHWLTAERELRGKAERLGDG